MTPKLKKHLWPLSLAVSCMLTAYSVTPTAAYLPHPAPTTQEQEYDDARWRLGQAELQLALTPWQDREFYAEKLAELGYQITAINYDMPSYLEYEVVKDYQTYEIQIDLGEKTNIATNVEIDNNMWRTEATERALATSPPLP